MNKTMEMHRMKKEMERHKNIKYEQNRFYVGSNSVLDRAWGHSTVKNAIEHAKELMDDQNMDETFIVQIIRVVKREHPPVRVEVIK